VSDAVSDGVGDHVEDVVGDERGRYRQLCYCPRWRRR
jgi:hypothetical protein